MKINKQLDFFLKLGRVHLYVSRVFDRSLGQGIGFSEFLILHSLATAPQKRLRRVDLADKIALTQSGVTRLLLPMEKIGLVGRESCDEDARVSYVTLAKSGERILKDTLEKAEMLAEEMLPSVKLKHGQEAADIFALFRLGMRIE